MNRIAALNNSTILRDWGEGVTWLLASENANGLRALDSTTVYKDCALIKSGPNNTHVYQLHPIPDFYIAMSIAIKKKRAKILDVMRYAGFLLMSEKALKILDDVDDVRHQRLPVDITLWDGSKLEGNYHLVHPLRSVKWEYYTGPDINSTNVHVRREARYFRGINASDDIKEFISSQPLWISRKSTPFIFVGEPLISALIDGGCSGVDLEQMEKIKKNSGALTYV
ncbi:MAG: DUF1629 domain-containing protein [Thalassolituus sp.]|uniref:imm11 family protein n=1 Tax=Thalassolituus sp. TaxID=2030822 RepID=UPI003981A650